MSDENVYDSDINDVETFRDLEDYLGLDGDEFDEDGNLKELEF